jgi:hypothetical protein
MFTWMVCYAVILGLGSALAGVAVAFAFGGNMAQGAIIGGCIGAVIGFLAGTRGAGATPMWFVILWALSLVTAFVVWLIRTVTS